MRRSTESSSARGGLVSCTRNKNITCFPSANAHVGPSRSSITLAFEARLARDAWSHQFKELRAVPAVCLTRADEISSQHAARPPLGSSSLARIDHAQIWSTSTRSGENDHCIRILPHGLGLHSLRTNFRCFRPGKGGGVPVLGVKCDLGFESLDGFV